MPKIVLTDAKMNMLQGVWQEINALGQIEVTKNDHTETLIQAVADADLIITCYASITRQIIQSGKKLKAVLK
jgi:phosphoglycerate dehydrogenase-like enzyme